MIARSGIEFGAHSMMARPGVKRGHYAVAGCLGGNKKAKAERNAGSSIDDIDVSINMFVDSMNANTKELYERSDERWKEIKEAQRYKLAL
jgi:hypothetical protein